MVDWVPGPPRRGANVRSMIEFGGRVAGSYFVGSLTSNAANVLIGGCSAAGPLGLYSKTWSLITKPVNHIVTPTGNVAITALSRIQDDPECLLEWIPPVREEITFLKTLISDLRSPRQLIQPAAEGNAIAS